MNLAARIGNIGPPVLRETLERDANQLAACPHACLIEELLDDCFYGSFGNLQFDPDFFIGQPLEDPFEHRALSRIQGLDGALFVRFPASARYQ